MRVIDQFSNIQLYFLLSAITLFFLLVLGLYDQGEKKFLSFESYNNAATIPSLTDRQLFYAELDGFPHNYEFTIENPTKIYLEIVVPDIETEANNRDVIIVKKNIRKPVDEIGRLVAKETAWQKYYHFITGDSYRRGGSIQQELAAGEYFIEVSSVENEGKYVLHIGKENNQSIFGVLKNLSNTYKTKRFFEKIPLSVLQSPYYLVLLAYVFLCYRVSKRLRHNSAMDRSTYEA